MAFVLTLAIVGAVGYAVYMLVTEDDAPVAAVEPDPIPAPMPVKHKHK